MARIFNYRSSTDFFKGSRVGGSRRGCVGIESFPSKKMHKAAALISRSFRVRGRSLVKSITAFSLNNQLRHAPSFFIFSTIFSFFSQRFYLGSPQRNEK